MSRFGTRTVTMTLITLVAFAGATLGGCFNTYRFQPEEFAKLQRADDIPVTVKSKGGDEILVERETGLYVRSTGGRRYPITAYNFKMTASQLVASDRDTLLSLGEIESYEVDLLSTWKTVLLITAGVAVASGLIVFTVVSADEE